MKNFFGKKCKHQKITIKEEKYKIYICEHAGNLCKNLNNCCDKCCPINYGYLNNLKNGE